MDCKICVAKNCDCLCKTCTRVRVIESMPEYLYEASDYTRRQWIDNQMREPKSYD